VTIEAIRVESCNDCDRPLPADGTGRAIVAGVGTVCEPCRPRYFVTCDDCRDVVHIHDTCRTNNDKQVCDDCRANSYSTCERCGSFAPDERVTTVQDGDVVCLSCRADNYVECDRCHEYHLIEDSTTTGHGSDICPSCRSDYYWQCDRCDVWNRDGSDCYNDCCQDDCTCDECENGSGVLRSYSYKPYPIFRGDGPLYLGPEIEVEVDHGHSVGQAAGFAADKLGELGYLKEDSSLGRGFEIVTHPMTYAWAMEHFPWDMLPGLVDQGCFVNEYNNGLHVHVSRDGFASPQHRYRWMKFVYRNKRQVIALARRESHNYAAFDEHERRRVKDLVKGPHQHYGNRYAAINPQNADTFELRMFASSLVVEEVKAAFGFAHASVEYTRQLSYCDITKGGWAWGAFTDWLAIRPDYSPLRNQISKRINNKNEVYA